MVVRRAMIASYDKLSSWSNVVFLGIVVLLTGYIAYAAYVQLTRPAETIEKFAAEDKNFDDTRPPAFLIADVFKRVLERMPDAAEMDYYFPRFTSGAMNASKLERVLVATREYERLSKTQKNNADTGAPRNLTMREMRASVSEVFSKVYGRDIDEETELPYFMSKFVYQLDADDTKFEKYVTAIRDADSEAIGASNAANPGTESIDKYMDMLKTPSGSNVEGFVDGAAHPARKIVLSNDESPLVLKRPDVSEQYHDTTVDYDKLSGMIASKLRSNAEMRMGTKSGDYCSRPTTFNFYSGAAAAAAGDPLEPLPEPRGACVADASIESTIEKTKTDAKTVFDPPKCDGRSIAKPEDTTGQGFAKLIDDRNADLQRMQCKRTSKYLNADDSGKLIAGQEWSVPQKHPPVCVRPLAGMKDPSPLTEQTALIGTLLDDAKLTEVGSILPRATYRPEVWVK
jgi:hypothetical protein